MIRCGLTEVVEEWGVELPGAIKNAYWDARLKFYWYAQPASHSKRNPSLLGCSVSHLPPWDWLGFAIGSSIPPPLSPLSHNHRNPIFQH
jgi:hypothetical protein